METVWIVLCLTLLILCIVLFGKLIAIKKQLKSFKIEAEALKKEDYRKPIRINSFDKYIVEIANVLNAHIQMQKEFSVLYRNKEQQLHDIIIGISHDFRTPLTAIKGYLQMIDKSEKLCGKEQEYLKIVLQKTDYLKSLSDDFFEISVSETEKEIQFEDVDICVILIECLCGQYEKIQTKNIDTHFDIPNTRLVIESNAHILNRIFENLISNMIKYAKSSMEVCLKQENNTIIFEAANDIDDSSDIDIKNVFAPFYRGSSKKEDGSGIGLYVVKSLAERLNFEIWADFDKRGYFTITLTYKFF